MSDKYILNDEDISIVEKKYVGRPRRSYDSLAQADVCNLVSTIREKFVASIKRWQANNPEKRRAHWIVNNALAQGKLTKGSCSIGSDCKGRIEAHHEDYSKPLEVIWLCRRHHRQADNERRNQEAAA